MGNNNPDTTLFLDRGIPNTAYRRCKEKDRTEDRTLPTPCVPIKCIFPSSCTSE